ncbi:MAG: leucine-rich repeat domain-containing protein [Bacteroidales bacterium]|nr:leucine-rich repeat domain-containing protein [Bacteroidales bacterium]
MKKILYILAICAPFFFSCSLEKPETHSRVTFLIGAEPGFQDTQTRIGMSEGQAIWEGDEVLSVLLANSGSSSSAEGKQISLPSSSSGIFTGSADLSPFTVADLRAAVVPAQNSAWYDGPKDEIVLSIAESQVQQSDGVFNGDFVPFYAFVNEDSFITGDNTYTLHSMILNSSAAIIRFNVYGKAAEMEDGEKLKSLTLHAAGNKGLSGTIRIGRNGAWSVAGTPSSTVKILLEEASQVTGKDRSNGVKAFVALLPYGNASENVTIDSICVSTDKADYSARFNETISPRAGEVIQAAIDLAGFGNKAIHAEFSVDGGLTWTTSLPVTFRSLSVRGNLQESDLQTIRTAIDGQALPVNLDLSQAKYVSAIFPSVFGSDGETQCKMLASILLPQNVTTLDEGCFMNCTGLSEVPLPEGAVLGNKAFYNCSYLLNVDFSKIRSIGSNAFGNVPLTKVDLRNAAPGTTVAAHAFLNESLEPDKSIDSVFVGEQVICENYSFYRLYALRYLYLDASSCGIAFSWQTSSYVTPYEHTGNLTVVLGPHSSSTSLTFWTNANVDKVIIEDGASGLAGNVFGCCRYLREIECRSQTVAPSILATTFRYYDVNGNNASRSTGYNIPASQKKLRVPAGSETLYNTGIWKTVVQDQLGYQLTPVTFN